MITVIKLFNSICSHYMFCAIKFFILFSFCHVKWSKNKAGDLSSGNNYRPIALANVISKVFESLILLRCEQFLTTADNQFGFKSRHSTDFCIYTLKEYIEFYKLRNTSVFVTFLDASKAFDHINHWLLFKKIIEKRVPLFIIKLLVCWYSTQQMHIRWGNTTTSSFFVSNGEKQGGILSPILFNVYIDQLSVKLNASNIGGDIGGVLINHLCYADDICLISLSSAGMQQLLNICDTYAKEYVFQHLLLTIRSSASHDIKKRQTFECFDWHECIMTSTKTQKRLP